MPSKRTTGRAGGAGPGSKEDDEHDKRVSRGSSVKVQMPKLDANNYDDWMKCLETQAYASGEEAMEMLEQSKASEEDDPDPDDPTDVRRIMWKLIMDALSPAMRARYKEVKLGSVEKLLRALRASHALVSSSARWGWFERLQSLELGDLGIEDYFALAENIFEKLRLQGDTLDESRKVFAVLRGLPYDYELAKSNLEIHHQREEPNYNNVKTYIKMWVSTRPGVPGHTVQAYNVGGVSGKRSGKGGQKVYLANNKKNYNYNNKNKKQQQCRYFSTGN